MSVSASVLRTHLDYTAWATQRLLDAAAALTPEELAHDFQTADRTIPGTLGHLFASDRIWLARLTGGTAPTFVSDADRDIATLRTEWPGLYLQWKSWAAGLTDPCAPAACLSRSERPRLRTASVAVDSARRQSRHPSSRAGFRISAQPWTRAAAARPGRLLPAAVVMIGISCGARLYSRCS